MGVQKQRVVVLTLMIHCSMYTGVFVDEKKASNSFKSLIGNPTWYLGSYRTAKGAASAYDQALLKREASPSLFQ